MSSATLPPFSWPREGYVHVADVCFWPFASADANRLGFEALSYGERTALAGFKQWIGEMTDVTLLPSPATLRIFEAIHSQASVLHFHIKPFAQGYCKLHISIAEESLSTVGELVRPSDTLRSVFWHVVQRHDPQMPLPTCNRDLCGFVGCGARCMSVPSDCRVKFHLDHVFQKYTRSSAVDDLGATPPGFKRPRLTGSRNALLDMPEDLLLRVVLLVSRRDRRELAAVSLDFAEFLAATVPGLKTRLFPHQMHALSRFLDLEAKAPKNRPIPLLNRLDVRGASTTLVFVDLVDGSILRLGHIPCDALPRGGLYCDEPGLGKTVTAIAVILKTLGQVPEAPTGYQTFENQYVPELKEYHVPLAGRYRSHGDDLVQSDPRRAKLIPGVEQRRSSLRRTYPPNYFQESKGQGSVPNVDQGARWESVLLSRATMIVVPDVLTEHWRLQIRQNVRRKKLRLLHLKSADDLPETVEELANNYDIILIAFEVVARLYNAMREWPAPMLMRMHFLRVIVDEGHFLSSANVTRFASVCNRIRAERRWVMTGTPTRSNLPISVDHLHHLLRFLKEESYGLDKQAWQAGIREPYSRCEPESLERLGSLLSSLMIRADKSMISTACEVKTVFLDFSQVSANLYNKIVEFARRNLICAGWYDESHCDSLLHPSNMRYARRVVSNLRMACCVEGTMEVTFTEEDVFHTLDCLYDNYASSARIQLDMRFDDPSVCQIDENVANVPINERWKPLQRLTESGARYLRLPADVYPRGSGASYPRTRRIYSGILCDIGSSLLDRRAQCALCLQYTRMPVVTPCGHMLCNSCVLLDKTRCTATDCAYVYNTGRDGWPYDLMEIQPAALSKDSWNMELEGTGGEKVAYLMRRFESLAPQIAVSHHRHPKIIVHGQHVDYLRRVAVRLQGSRFKQCYTEMNMNLTEEDTDLRKIRKASEYAQRSVMQFATNPNIFILLMSTRIGSVGLDLSFVEHIFLLEPVWDRAVELQVISRAHRIGAKGKLTVERLVMRDSIEHDMVKEMEANSQTGTAPRMHVDGPAKRDRTDVSRIKNLLCNLKLVRSRENMCGKRSLEISDSTQPESQRARLT